MKTIYFDLSMGAAGDMLTAALLELHNTPDRVLETLNRVFSGKAVLSVRKERKCGISGSHITVSIDGEIEGEETGHHSHEHAGCLEHRHGHEHGHSTDNEHCIEHRHHHHCHSSLSDVRTIISGLDLPESVIRDSLAVYDLIAEAEAKVHGQAMENIHFHEVGSLDAMADVVSVCYLMQELSPEKVFASPIHVGSGTVRCAHGELPVPAPATQELLKGIPIYSTDIRGELCTPTGAALLKYFVSEFGPMPMISVMKVGYGLGTKEFPRANGLRALLGDTEDHAGEQILELACNIDDMTGEEFSFARERLFEAGALDVTFTDIGMKKGRPGIMLSCICRPEQRDAVLTSLFRHTTSLGVREYICNRYTLSREFISRETPFGPIQVKRAFGYGVSREKPEYEDLRKYAEEHGLSLREVRNLIS